MAVRMKVSGLLLCALLGTSCSAIQPSEPLAISEQVSVPPQDECVQEWRDVLEQWEPHGSQPEALRVVRGELLRARSHKFARLVQQARDLQANRHLAWTGQWPVPEPVIQSVDSIVDAAAVGVVSAACESSGSYLLPLLLGEEVASERKSSQLYKLDVSAVDPSRSDPTQIGRWLFYWLLAGD